MLLCEKLFLFRNCQETVTRVFFDNAVFRQIARLALLVLLYLSEEINSLRLTAAKRDFGFMQIIGDAL